MNAHVVIYVNGYGAADVDDENYAAYLGQVRSYAEQKQPQRCEIYLCGGFTNQGHVSEAAAMRKWFGFHGLPANCTLHLIEYTTTARENLEAFHNVVGDIPVVIFCEWSRRYKMQWLAQRVFSEPEVIGVPFDSYSLRPDRQLAEFMSGVLEIVAPHFAPAEWLRKRLRKRTVTVAQQRAAGSHH